MFVHARLSNTKTVKFSLKPFSTFLSPDKGSILVSISPTFYEQLLRQNPVAKKLETQIVST
jgi:hypothetical protein